MYGATLEWLATAIRTRGLTLVYIYIYIYIIIIFIAIYIYIYTYIQVRCHAIPATAQGYTCCCFFSVLAGFRLVNETTCVV